MASPGHSEESTTMDPSLFRKFWAEVVGIDKPKPKTTVIPGKHAADVAQGPEQQAEAAVDASLLAQRLASLAGPFKQAVGDQGPDAPQLHSLFSTIKSQLGKKQFADASDSL